MRALVVVLALAAAVACGVWGMRGPAPVPASAPATEFSSERAMGELAKIAAKPHPTGSAAADDVREYLVQRLEALGFAVEVQDATALTDAYAARAGLPVVAAHVRNVIARRRGTQPGPALVLTAHYDSRELAPGASDDGYGTAALLETARALSASPPLRHDVILLLTEGEEQGLLGARAFVGEHPAAKDAGLVLNFEARGDRGPVSMFQTSEGAGALVDVVARAAPHVDASSLSQEVYRRMPNDTDLTVWLRAGKPGLNFANADGFGRYHEPTDSLANADASTLQHHGSYALALARAFADRDVVAPPRDGDKVYFTIGRVLVHYPAREATTLAGLGAGLLAIAIGVGAWRRRLRPGGLVGGAAAALVAVALGVAAADGAWWVADRVSQGALGRQVARGDAKTACVAGLVALGAAVAWTVITAAMRRFRGEDVALGALVLWAALALASAFGLPGASYLFAWPLLAAGAAWCLRVAARSMAAAHPAAIVAHLIAAVLAVVLLVPLALELGIAFGPAAAPALGALGALATAAAVPSIETLGGRRPWIAPAVVLAGSVACVVVACAMPPFDASAPRPDSLLYVLDADRGTAAWVSTDAQPDAWTGQVLVAPARSTMPELFPRSRTELLHAPAPAIALDTPRIGILEETRSDAGRALHLRVTLPAGTEIAGLAVPPDAHVTAASVQEKAFGTEANDGWLDLAFFGPPASGLDVVLTTAAAAPVTLRIVAQTRGLPASLAARLGPRPPDRMPAVVQWNPTAASDMTLVTSSFQL